MLLIQRIRKGERDETPPVDPHNALDDGGLGLCVLQFARAGVNSLGGQWRRADPDG
jgi:hypothetical protein